MKKMIALAMAMTMGLSLVACGSSDTAASTLCTLARDIASSSDNCFCAFASQEIAERIMINITTKTIHLNY